MARFLEILTALAVGAVTLVQHPASSWAAETTGRGITASAYVGGGTLEVPNNEGGPGQYDERRGGLGVVGVIRFADGANSERGLFVKLAATAELEALRQTACGWGCDSEAAEASFRTDKTFGGRLGLGYSFSLVELNGGVLVAIPDANSRVAESLIMPEVLVRLGRRSIGWFELGLGAYDASTNLRPGLFVGGAYGSDEWVRISGHLGLHVPNGLCCSTVPRLGFRYELGLDHAVSEIVRVGLGGAVYNAEAIEGAARLSVLL